MTELHRVAEAGIRLSADRDCDEQRASASGNRIVWMLAFLVRDDSELNGYIISECFFHDIFSDKSKFSIVKQTNLHDALSSCCLSLFVAVNNLEHFDAIFNSVQVSQSTSKPSSYAPLFRDWGSYFVSFVN